MACISSSVRYATSFISPLSMCQDLPDLVQRGWHLILDIAHERLMAASRPFLVTGRSCAQSRCTARKRVPSGIDLFQVKLG